MKRFMLVGCVLVGLVLASAPAAPAQDFNQLLKAVEKIELNLKKLVEQEAQARSQELAKLRLEMKAISTGQTGQDYQTDLDKLAQAIESLQLLGHFLALENFGAVGGEIKGGHGNVPFRPLPELAR